MDPLNIFITAVKYLRDSNNPVWSKVAVVIIAAICFLLAIRVLELNVL